MTTKKSRAPYDTNKVLEAPSPDTIISNADNLSGDKEEIRRLRVVMYDARQEPGHKLRTVVDARWWMGRSSSANTVYCSVWVGVPSESDGRHTYDYNSGRGQAGGYGYCKISAALGAAITSAGYRLEAPIDGCGERAMEHALMALARAHGYHKATRTMEVL